MNKSLSLFVILVALFQQSTAATNISGQIRNNITWTKANSPYILSGLVEVAPGITLTIEPGTSIEMDDGLAVYGTINAAGTDNDNITIKFTGTNSFKTRGLIECPLQTNSHSVLNFEYCYFDLTNVDTKDYGRVTISDCYFNWCSARANGKNSFLKMNNSTIIEGSVTSGTSDTCILTNNLAKNSFFRIEKSNYSKIEGNNISGHDYGIQCRENVVCSIQDNIVTNTKVWAVSFDLQNLNGDVPFTGNIISNNKGVGLYLLNASGDFEHNIFDSNKTAVVIRNYNNSMLVNIRHNGIYHNETGIEYRTESQATIEDNCIYDNTPYDFYNTTDKNYKLGKNWWGTTDSSTIESKVYDYEDDFKRGKVSFMPVTQNNSQCKTSPPPTDIPNHTKDRIAINAYPNPFSQSFTISITGAEDIAQIIVFNLVGTQMSSIKINNQKQITVDATSYAPGIYIYKIISNNNQIITGKIVRQ